MKLFLWFFLCLKNLKSECRVFESKWLIFCSTSQDQSVKINAAVRFFSSYMKNDFIFFTNDSVMQEFVCKSIIRFIRRQFLYQCKVIQSTENHEYWNMLNDKNWKWIFHTTCQITSCSHEEKTLRNDELDNHRDS
jgi:hypothetical protein